MARTVTKAYDIEIDLADFADEDIRDEASIRGLLPEVTYLSDYSNDEIWDEADARGLFNESDEDTELGHIRWEWNNGSKQEALKLLKFYMEDRGFVNFSL